MRGKHRQRRLWSDAAMVVIVISFLAGSVLLLGMLIIELWETC